jgi:hypothetical protein
MSLESVLRPNLSMVRPPRLTTWFLQGKRIFTGAVLGAAWESETGTQALSHIKD